MSANSSLVNMNDSTGQLDVTISMDNIPELSVAVKALRGITVLIISLSIIASNFVNITVLRRTKEIPQVAKTFLINLGCADLSVGLISCLPSVIPGISGNWPYGDVWCQISGILHGTTVTVSIWTVAVVSVERFFAVIYPLKSKNKLDKKKCLGIISFLWIAALGTFMAPNFVDEEFLYYKFNEGSGMCGMYWENTWLCIVSAIYIPFLSGFTIVVTTVKITKTLKKTKSVGSKNVSNSRNEASSLRKQRDKMTVNLLIATTTAFFVFWGPYVVMTMATVFSDTISAPGWIEFVATWLANSNSFVNVIIYSTLYDAFRKQVKSLFVTLAFCKKRPRHVGSEGRRITPHFTEASLSLT